MPVRRSPRPPRSRFLRNACRGDDVGPRRCGQTERRQREGQADRASGVEAGGRERPPAGHHARGPDGDPRIDGAEGLPETPVAPHGEPAPEAAMSLAAMPDGRPENSPDAGGGVEGVEPAVGRPDPAAVPAVDTPDPGHAAAADEEKAGPT